MRDDVTLYRRLSLAGRIHKMTSARLHLPIQGVGPPPESSLMRNSLTPALVTLIRVPPMTSHSVRAAAADTPLLESCGWMHFLPNCSGQLSGQTGFAGIDTIILKNTLQWRRNDHGGVSNHQPHGCLLNRLFRRRSKKTSRLRVTGLCAGGIHSDWSPVNSPQKGQWRGKCFHLMTSSWRMVRPMSPGPLLLTWINFNPRMDK